MLEWTEGTPKTDLDIGKVKIHGVAPLRLYRFSAFWLRSSGRVVEELDRILKNEDDF